MNRSTVYWAVNAAFLLLIAVGVALGGSDSSHPLYLILLFALCSTPIFNARRFNDRYALLTIFSMIYFQYFGLIDLINLLTAKGIQPGILSATEALILVGGCLLQLGYRMTCGTTENTDAMPRKDWPETTLVVAGILIWLVATYLSWQFKVNIITAATAEATARGLANLSGLQTMGYLLAIMVQPLGIMIIAYVQCHYRRSYLLPLLIVVVIVQFALGFVADAKGDALIGAAIILITRLLTTGKIPKVWLITMITLVAVAFPVLQANRNLRGQYRIDHAEAAQNVVETLKQAVSKSDDVKSGEIKAENFFERTSLKGSVEMIVTRTGTEVAYQHGYTLTPLYAAFIPKIIWRDKPDVQTGLLVNTEFKVAPGAFVYISPSHLGELYWNFGWPGSIVGMFLIGSLLGYIGKWVDMTKNVSITQLMITAVTIKALIMGFESSIAAIYVTWLRSMAAIGLLHLLFARPVATIRRLEGDELKPAREASQVGVSASLPNLLR